MGEINQTPKILFEDNHVLVAVKPAGILSQADQTGDKDILTILKDYIKETYQKPGNVYLGLVHRLDRPVGGVMVFAKTSKAAARISNQIQEHTFKKYYLAVVEGTFGESQATLKHYIRKSPSQNVVEVFDKNVNLSKEAILTYKVIDSVDNQSLVEIELMTGRPHQIRAQMSHVGHPLLGDYKYSHKKMTDKSEIHHVRFALSAYKVSFEHPTTKETLEFTEYPSVNQEPWSKFKLPVHK